MPILHLKGCTPEVYRIIGPIAMNHEVIKKRKNLPIITKETYTWIVLRVKDSVKALVGLEEAAGYMKLQAFVVLGATKKQSRSLIKDAQAEFLKTQYAMLTVSVLHEYAELFEKEGFVLVFTKTNWTDLIFYRYEKTQ